MKLIISISILAIIIIAVAIIGNNSIISTSETLHSHLTNLENNIREENWEQAGISNQTLGDNWNRAQKLFSLMVDHENLHDLSITLTRISSHIELEEKKQILTEIKVAKMLLQAIKDEEKLSLENVF